MTLCNQGKAVHSSHVTMDDMENAMTVVCVTMLISMPTPIIGVKFHFHSLDWFIYQLFAHEEENNTFNMILLLSHINSSHTPFFYRNKFAYRKPVFLHVFEIAGVNRNFLTRKIWSTNRMGRLQMGRKIRL